jgi:hypothetical protein
MTFKLGKALKISLTTLISENYCEVCFGIFNGKLLLKFSGTTFLINLSGCIWEDLELGTDELQV